MLAYYFVIFTTCFECKEFKLNENNLTAMFNFEL